MDPNTTSDSSPGGTVEPERGPAAARQRTRPLQEPSVTERYELRDPFAEVTYRSKSFDDIVAHAERLGAERLYAVATDNTRTAIVKIEGAWRREASPSRAEAGPSQSEAEAIRDARGGGKASPEPKVDHPSDSQAQATRPRGEAEAARRAYVERLEAALSERYLIKRAPLMLGDVTLGRTEYRYRGDTSRVAFTESTYRLATDVNHPSVARSMVDVAEARNWKAVRVSGHEDFRRMVWLEASLRGVKALGYEPQVQDLELLQRQREARQVNRIEPTLTSGSDAAEKASGRGSGGRKAVLVALEALLVARQVPARQREAVMAAAEANLARRVKAGEVHRVKVYDRSAAPQPGSRAPSREMQRSREQSGPVR